MARVACAVALVVAVASPQVARADDLREARIRAAFVLNVLKFTKFSEPVARDNHVDLCLQTQGRAKESAFRALRHRRLHGLRLRVHVLDDRGAVPSRCEVLYTNARKPPPRLGEKASLLMIGETESFVSSEGAISLVRQGNRLQILIRPENSPFTFDARLLRLASIVN